MKDHFFIQHYQEIQEAILDEFGATAVMHRVAEWCEKQAKREDMDADGRKDYAWCAAEVRELLKKPRPESVPPKPRGPRPQMPCSSCGGVYFFVCSKCDGWGCSYCDDTMVELCGRCRKA
jgi:hypothetical protein